MKFRRLTAFALSLAAAAAVVSGANDFQPIVAHAAKASVEQVQQEYQIPGVEAKVAAQSNGIVTLTWEAVEGADRYTAYKISGENNEVRERIGETTGTCYTFTEVEGGKTNRFAIVSEKKLGDDSYTGGKPCEIDVAQPLYAPEFTLTPYSKSVKIAWKQSYGATSYRMYSYDLETKKYTRIHTSYATTRSYTVKNLEPDKQYFFVVRAVSNASGKNKLDEKMAPVQTVFTNCLYPEFSNITNEMNKVTFSWKAAGDNISGYQIWAKEIDADTKYVKLGNISAKKTSYTTSKNLEKNKNYSFKIRYYKKVNGKWTYSPWSAVKDIYTGLKTPEITKVNSAASGVKVDVTWSASNADIDGYQIWIKPDGAEKYVKVGNVSPKKLTKSITSGIAFNTSVKIRVRSYKKIDGAWAYSKWSKVAKATTGKNPEVKKYKIVLDPGHLKGGNKAGNDYDNVWYGYSEATMSLTLGKYMKTYLEDYGFEVLLTRTTDKAYDLDLNDRGKMAKGADFFLSLHSNAAGESAQTVYSYCSVDGKSDKIGKMLSAAVAKTMGVPDGGIIHLYDDDGKSNYYCVLRNAAKVGVSGILLEHSFHTNAYSRAWLSKNSNLKKLAAAEAKVIAQYYGLA